MYTLDKIFTSINTNYACAKGKKKKKIKYKMLEVIVLESKYPEKSDTPPSNTPEKSDHPPHKYPRK